MCIVDTKAPTAQGYYPFGVDLCASRRFLGYRSGKLAKETQTMKWFGAKDVFSAMSAARRIIEMVRHAIFGGESSSGESIDP